ncbi:MAG: DUF2239 family protein [Hyphomicrobiaceae bacterium]|nr:DUF2239 family protein [Hyphomicrobiaceae bacterium]
MPDSLTLPATAFAGHRLIAQGALAEVALAVKAWEARGAAGPVVTLDDRTGAVIDLDLRGSEAEIVARLAQAAGQAAGKGPAQADAAKPGPGRPRLGVVAREVTLLPRHWDWLAAQRGGASSALRRLVEEAIRTDGGRSASRAAQEACYRACTTLAGDLAGYEEAMRALFRSDGRAFARHTGRWPKDVRGYARRLAARAGLAPAAAAAG